jgi:hypothetical protein
MASATALALLGGCTSDGPTGAAGPGWGRGPGYGPMTGPGGDGAPMCAFHGELAQGTSSEAQRAAIEARMQSMHGGTLTAEQLRARREAMERHCAGAPAAR